MSSVNFRCLTITTNDGKRVQDQETGEYRRVYYVTINSDSTNVKRSFRFHASVWAERHGVVGLGATELFDAFRCFVLDAQAGSFSFREFCDDFGYDYDSRSAYSTYQACQAATSRYIALWHNVTQDSVHDHISSVLDELSEMGVE